MNNENKLTQNMLVSSKDTFTIKNPIDQISDNYTDIVTEALTTNKIVIDIKNILSFIKLKLFK